MDESTTQLLDLGPATATVADVVRAIRDDQLSSPTTCPQFTVADLLDHLGGLSFAFTMAASKTPIPAEQGSASADGSRLVEGWRDRIAAALTGLADAWRDPTAYDGLTMAGPVELPGSVAALVALDEVVLHGWDLARATGQEYAADPAAVTACLMFVSSFEPPDDADAPGLFGPPVPVPDDAPVLDRLLGAAGRDPAWTP